MITHSLNAPQYASQLGVIQVDLDTAQLRQFSDFPKNDCRDAPGFIAEQGALPSRQFAGQGVQQNVSVKIEHATSRRCSKYRP
jgi:hypothetical protein